MLPRTLLHTARTVEIGLLPVVILSLVLVSCSLLFGYARAAEVAGDENAPVTTSNPGIPVAELELLLKPLTRDELSIEAGGWLALLKAKVAEISAAQISVRRRTEEIRKAEDLAEAAGEAKEAIADSVQSETGASTAPPEVVVAQEAVAEMVEVEAESKVAEAAGSTVAEASNDAKPEVAGTDGEARSAATSVAAPSTSVDVSGGTAGAVDSTHELHAVQSKAEQAVAAKAQVKEDLLESVNELRAQRTALVDRLRAVLDAWHEKGGDTEELELYVKAVEGIQVDVSDTSATWSTVVGWVTSREGGVRWAFNLVWFLAITFAFWLLSIVVGHALYKSLDRARHVSVLLRDMLSTGVRRLIIIVGIIVGLSALEVNVGPVLAVIGAAGFVIAFALQDTLSNFASGIMILLYKPYDVGDVIDAAGVTGTVSSMNLVSTEIMTFDNKRMIVPNNSIWGNIVTNATGTDKRRVDMIFGIGYEASINQAEQVLNEIVTSHPLVLDDPAPNIKVHELADSSVNFICRPWTKVEDVWAVYWDVTRTVKERFDEAGISIPFPQRDVHVFTANVGAATELSAAAPALPTASKRP